MKNDRMRCSSEWVLGTHVPCGTKSAFYAFIPHMPGEFVCGHHLADIVRALVHHSDKAVVHVRIWQGGDESW